MILSAAGRELVGIQSNARRVPECKLDRLAVEADLGDIVFKDGGLCEGYVLELSLLYEAGAGSERTSYSLGNSPMAKTESKLHHGPVHA